MEGNAMRLKIIAVIKPLSFGAVTSQAQLLQSPPQTQTVPCDAFQKNPNGTWSPTRQVTITLTNGGSISIGPGVSFGSGVQFAGIDLYSLLQQNCH